MITKNYKNLLACVLTTRGSSNGQGMLPVKATNGTTYYINGYFSSAYPASLVTSFTTSANASGLTVGTGATAATDDDYKLQSQITSGVSGSVVMANSLDGAGNPQLACTLTLTNTGSSAITISEIGYSQNLNATTTQGGTSSSARTCLLDRTVLDTPVTIAAGAYAVIKYTLKTVVS